MKLEIHAKVTTQHKAWEEAGRMAWELSKKAHCLDGVLHVDVGEISYMKASEAEDKDQFLFALLDRDKEKYIEYGKKVTGKDEAWLTEDFERKIADTATAYRRRFRLENFVIGAFLLAVASVAVIAGLAVARTLQGL